MTESHTVSIIIARKMRRPSNMLRIYRSDSASSAPAKPPRNETKQSVLRESAPVCVVLLWILVDAILARDLAQEVVRHSGDDHAHSNVHDFVTCSVRTFRDPAMGLLAASSLASMPPAS